MLNLFPPLRLCCLRELLVGGARSSLRGGRPGRRDPRPAGPAAAGRTRRAGRSPRVPPIEQGLHRAVRLLLGVFDRRSRHMQAVHRVQDNVLEREGGGSPRRCAPANPINSTAGSPPRTDAGRPRPIRRSRSCMISISGRCPGPLADRTADRRPFPEWAEVELPVPTPPGHLHTSTAYTRTANARTVHTPATDRRTGPSARAAPSPGPRLVTESTGDTGPVFVALSGVKPISRVIGSLLRSYGKDRWPVRVVCPVRDFRPLCHAAHSRWGVQDGSTRGRCRGDALPHPAAP